MVTSDHYFLRKNNASHCLVGTFHQRALQATNSHSTAQSQFSIRYSLVAVGITVKCHLSVCFTVNSVVAQFTAQKFGGSSHIEVVLSTIVHPSHCHFPELTNLASLLWFCPTTGLCPNSSKCPSDVQISSTVLQIRALYSLNPFLNPIVSHFHILPKDISNIPSALLKQL